MIITELFSSSIKLQIQDSTDEDSWVEIFGP